MFNNNLIVSLWLSWNVLKVTQQVASDAPWWIPYFEFFVEGVLLVIVASFGIVGRFPWIHWMRKYSSLYICIFSVCSFVVFSTQVNYWNIKTLDFGGYMHCLLHWKGVQRQRDERNLILWTNTIWWEVKVKKKPGRLQNIADWLTAGELWGDAIWF